MRQTFQQWMVLLSALVLLLLPALLCHATPMYSVASSSSGAHSRDPSGTKELMYYVNGPFRLDPNRQPLTSDALDEHFGTHIHHDGKPVLFTQVDPKAKVEDALNSYGKVWLVGTTSGETQPRYMQLYLDKNRAIGIGGDRGGQALRQVQDARAFAAQYGEKAQHLRYGRPFAERKEPIFGYKVPKWKDILKAKNIPYNLKTTGFPHLRATLDQHNFLKVHDPVGKKLLGFALDKKGEVLFKDFSEHVRV
ncbi:uncharacterized protein UBRO_20819 [Ustilago bromivora]|uniref:Uncharacterized protein n=1 Tax=Ustilago bromivora TaxID=307758 RepID=A0A1K0HHM8_9BASI|nr:uncharacterized protein UBRO_20819 [Ustilago bromivora]